MQARHAALAVLLLTVAGCLPAWVGPTREDAATLTFVLGTAASVHAYAFGDGKECRNQMNVGPEFGYLKDKTTIRIPPDAEFTTLATFLGGNWSCNIVATFVPKARGAYVARLDGTAQRCELGIGRLEGGKVLTEPTARSRKWKPTTYGSGGRQCE